MGAGMSQAPPKGFTPKVPGGFLKGIGESDSLGRTQGYGQTFPLRWVGVSLTRGTGGAQSLCPPAGHPRSGSGPLHTHLRSCLLQLQCVGLCLKDHSKERSYCTKAQVRQAKSFPQTALWGAESPGIMVPPSQKRGVQVQPTCHEKMQAACRPLGPCPRSPPQAYALLPSAVCKHTLPTGHGSGRHEGEDTAEAGEHPTHAGAGQRHGSLPHFPTGSSMEGMRVQPPGAEPLLGELGWILSRKPPTHEERSPAQGPSTHLIDHFGP